MTGPFAWIALRRNSRAAFTLIELLVVVAIIALLVAILTTAVAQAKASGWRMRCAINQRELMAACLMYASESRDALPMPNWASQDPAPGWLYRPPLRPNGTSPRLDLMETGLVWRYLTARPIYRCPRDDPPYTRTARLTSYLMNGAVAGYGRRKSEQGAFKIPQLRVNSLTFWEAGETTWNDGSSYPSEGLTRRHGNGATVVGVDGHTEWMTHLQYQQQLDRLTMSKLWCAPDTPDGH